jgi:membrane protease YdiL (CAAX protease family)
MTETPARVRVAAAERAAMFQGLSLFVGASCSMTLRAITSGAAGSQSPVGGLVFAGCLLGLAYAAGVSRPRHCVKGLLSGVGGGLVLVAVALVRSGLSLTPAHSLQEFLPWILVAGAVAVSEEALLRDVLFTLVAQRRGELAAVLLGAAAFAIMHVPLYGWQVLPLDFAVGLLLGMLRVLSGSWTAPALAHVVADAAGWWLR